MEPAAAQAHVRIDFDTTMRHFCFSFFESCALFFLPRCSCWLLRSMHAHDQRALLRMRAEPCTAVRREGGTQQTPAERSLHADGKRRAPTPRARAQSRRLFTASALSAAAQGDTASYFQPHLPTGTLRSDSAAAPVGCVGCPRADPRVAVFCFCVAARPLLSRFPRLFVPRLPSFPGLPCLSLLPVPVPVPGVRARLARTTPRRAPPLCHSVCTAAATWPPLVAHRCTVVRRLPLHRAHPRARAPEESWPERISTPLPLPAKRGK